MPTSASVQRTAAFTKCVWCTKTNHFTSIKSVNILSSLSYRWRHSGAHSWVVCQRFKASKQYSSVQLLSHVRLWNPKGCSTPGFPVQHQLLEFTQTHVHTFGDAIQPSHPLSSPSPPAFNLSQHQGLFKWVSSLHQVAKVLEFQLQHQSFQWIFRTDSL